VGALGVKFKAGGRRLLVEAPPARSPEEEAGEGEGEASGELEGGLALGVGRWWT